MQLTIDLRPRKLSEVYGHPLIIKSLVNRTKDKVWPTATILKGFSGTGKTTIAQIMACTINCKELDANGDPCLKCPSCLSVTSERFDRDIQRIDGSVSGKSDMIDFTQYASAAPFYDSNKSIFIIEEVDQMSSKAINALLKVIEAPLVNVHFIILSMNPKAIELPAGSRNQSFSFSPFFQKDILLGLQQDLKRIGKWGVPEIPKTFYTEVLRSIASSCQGSYRQALQHVESCLYAEAWTSEDFINLTGAVDTETVVDALSELFSRKKGFFLTLDRINFQEFFNKSFDMLADAYTYKKTGVVKNYFFEEQIKTLSQEENLEKVLNIFYNIYETNPSYVKKAHAIFKLASLY